VRVCSGNDVLVGSMNISADDRGCIDILSDQRFAVCSCETFTFMLRRVAACDRRRAYANRRGLLLILDWRTLPSLFWDGQNSRPVQMHYRDTVF
jgi:hypothetical protein